MSDKSREWERWDAYLEGLRKKPGELDDMLPMFEYWVYSGYASEVEWRLAIEVTDLRKRLDAMEEPGEDTKVTLNYAPDANARELADGIAREISLRVRGAMMKRRFEMETKDTEESETLYGIAHEAAAELLASMKETESVDERVAIANAISSLLAAL